VQCVTYNPPRPDSLPAVGLELPELAEKSLVPVAERSFPLLLHVAFGVGYPGFPDFRPLVFGKKHNAGSHPIVVAEI